MKIILAGYMGSGKTAVGNQLALKSGIPFLDLDQEIAAMEKRTIPEIFQTSGEIHFRKKENEVLKDLVASEKDVILALGGGTPCYANNLELIKDDPDSKMIYLKTSLQELTRRLFDERESRPLISHLDTRELLEDFIRKHLFERVFYYNQAAVILETDGRSAEELATEILEHLQ